MVHEGISPVSRIVGKIAPNPSGLNRGRSPCGREPPVERRTPFPENIPLCLCVSLGPVSAPLTRAPYGAPRDPDYTAFPGKTVRGAVEVGSARCLKRKGSWANQIQPKFTVFCPKPGFAKNSVNFLGVSSPHRDSGAHSRVRARRREMERGLETKWKAGLAGLRQNGIRIIRDKMALKLNRGCRRGGRHSGRLLRRQHSGHRRRRGGGRVSAEYGPAVCGVASRLQ